MFPTVSRSPLIGQALPYAVTCLSPSTACRPTTPHIGLAKDRPNRTYRRPRVCRRRVQIPRVSQEHASSLPPILDGCDPLLFDPGSKRNARRCRRTARFTATPCEVSPSPRLADTDRCQPHPTLRSTLHRPTLAMTSAQARLADTIANFYTASDRTSDGAMAGHAFKSAVEDLDNSVQRELASEPCMRPGRRDRD